MRNGCNRLSSNDRRKKLGERMNGGKEEEMMNGEKNQNAEFELKTKGGLRAVCGFLKTD